MTKNKIKFYIAYDPDGKPLSIVIAKNKRLAIAFWQGKGIQWTAMKTHKDFIPLDEHLTGVYPILTTSVERVSLDYGARDSEEVVVRSS